MAPPSIVEFFLVSLVRSSAMLVVPEIRDRLHIADRACLFDLTLEPVDARYKVLVGHVCPACRAVFELTGRAELLAAVESLIQLKWLGKRDDPASPASVCAKLGFDLFITKGARPTFAEDALSVLGSEAAKQVIQVLGVVLAGALLFWLGLKEASK